MGTSFLRIPPFPGHRSRPLTQAAAETTIDRELAARLAHLLPQARVGGAFWAAQPEIPEGRDILLAPCSRQQALDMIEGARTEDILERCIMLRPEGESLGDGGGVPMIDGPADPWHLADKASLVWAGADHELALVAALDRRPMRIFGVGQFARCSDGEEGLIDSIQQVGSLTYRSPFSEERISPLEAVELLGSWRRLVDGNRTVGTVFGVAGWKRPTVDPLLWDGKSGPRHARILPARREEMSSAIVWKSRTPAAALGQLERSNLALAEIEDGMIRGPGLGANCVPPLSVVVDFSGIYFDPSQTSDLEQILILADMEPELVDRAARLREAIVAAGISKYGSGAESKRKSVTKRQILVVGQVEDDRSILSGGAGQTNLELLERTRSLEPDAWLIYRPHPDVDAGHRQGHVADEIALRHADEIDRGSSIGSLIETVDEVHCITSLAGFEALMRGKPVTTHGVPFYSGWGLTNDLGAVPGRRTRHRTLDELIAGALILYPRYIDPVTRLPCSPEVLVKRMARGEAAVAAPLAGMRILQGKLNLALRRLRETAT